MGIKKDLKLFTQHYDSIEYFFGVLCPLLSVLSLLDHLGAVRWAWALLFWMSAGHFSLYLYNLYPQIRHRPFAKGLFVFGVGMMWPVWCVLQFRKKRPVGLR